jgi:hypothetical protein
VLVAANPTYSSLARIGAVAVSTANTNRDGTGTVATIITAVAAGTRIDRIVLKATADPADSVVTLFLHDGTNYFLFDEFDLGNPAAASTTVAGYREERAYSDLILPSGWSLRAAITVALTAGVINVVAFGADLT